ncbi:AAA family ATPase [Brucepastera parasyntrophica]|uniref:AAA family ATPase n=1 Tax=Brucepastera parasyntrophica TaxID=2880008 RepID=UPI00210D6D58|nr:AAA family ATPase [Brucepastera parasyntrophica]ULQ60209.1 AAA family ATPase [Brucepastera parasyntrophica]
MFLKSLEVFGFKSFADRTNIEFADGITALLGPNGCGKSNVVDAVKWVLGEQSAKTMRADKMEDIIFNGTESRKPLNVAEVTLTIANENGFLNLDMSEIAIKRRLYRSGESEYFINNAPVKLKDIRELFWDTGVGKAAYSVMEQGKIDQILSSKPEDRRYLFEEAAGITKFKVRRAEAERKLEKTEENMRQIEGILGEVKRSYESLKVQAEKTAQYRALREVIFENELDIQLLRLKGFFQDRDRRSSTMQETQSQRDSIKNEIDEITASLEENMDAVNSLQTTLNDYQKKLIGFQVEKNEKSKLARVLTERSNEVKSKLDQLEHRKLSVNGRIENLREDADEQDAAVHELNRRITEIDQNIVSFEGNITASSNRISENERQAAGLESEIESLNNDRSTLGQELQAITEDIVTRLDKKLRDAGYSSRAHTEAEDAVSSAFAQIRVLVEGRRNIFSDFSHLHNPSVQDVRHFAENAVASFTELEKMLANLESAIDGYKKTMPGFIDEFLSPDGIITQKRQIDEKIRLNRETVAEKRSRISALQTENNDLSDKIDEYKNTLHELRLNQVQMKTQSAAAEEQARLIRRELASQEAQLREVENEIFSENARLEDITEQIHDIESELASIERQGIKLAEEMERLENDILSRNSDVTGKQGTLKKHNAEMIRIQSQLEKLHMDMAMNETEIRNLQENFRENHSRDLMEFEERMYVLNIPAGELRERLSEARRKLKDLGSVNLMAVEEFAETKERYEFLNNQIADLQKARDDLKRITEEIRAESTEIFLATYNKIKKNFHNMFRRLFGGGRGEIRLIDPNNVLESGIEIFAQPPGKKLENINLLSGGEKSMTAVALLFATYMVKPSPFCLLDEIDAALDDQNVSRFIHTLREFANVSQYIIITHNKKTVMGANTMLGITMEESGITKVLSIKLENESAPVDEKLPDIENFVEEDVPPEENVVIPPHPPKRVRTAEDSGGQE